MISLTTIELLIKNYGYIVFFILAVIEGPIATIIAAFLASLGFLNVVIVYAVAIAGDLVGDVLYYSIGLAGKKRLVRRGKFLGITKEKMTSIAKHFETKGGKTIFLGKVTHSLGFVVLITAGLVGMPMIEFLGYNFLGTIPKSLIFTIVGYYFGHAYQSINTYLDYLGFIAFGLIVLSALAYWFSYRKKKQPSL